MPSIMNILIVSIVAMKVLLIPVTAMKILAAALDPGIKFLIYIEITTMVMVTVPPILIVMNMMMTVQGTEVIIMIIELNQIL